MKAAEELNDTLETEASSSMRRCTILESIDVVFDLLDWNSAGLSSLCQHLRVVNTLRSTGDLFTSHEEVVRVGVVGVIRVEHGVEGAGVDGVAVKHVEIGVMSFLDETSESLLGFSAEILEGILLDASFLEHGNTILEVNLDDWVRNLELLEGILVVDN